MAGRSLTAFTASTGLMGPFVVPVQGVFSYIYGLNKADKN